MMNKVRSNIIFTWLFLFLIFQVSAQEKWKLSKEKEGITIHTSENGSASLKSFRAHMIIDASLGSFVATLLDVERLTDWGYSVSHASVLERSGDTLQIYYSIAKTPFAFKNRDGIYLNRFRWDKDSQTLMVDIEVLPEYQDRKENMVRVEGSGFWKVVVLPQGKLDITYQLHVDPGGSIPAWLTNLFINDFPFETMAGLRKAVTDKKYQNQEFDFLK